MRKGLFVGMRTLRVTEPCSCLQSPLDRKAPESCAGAGAAHNCAVAEIGYPCESNAGVSRVPPSARNRPSRRHL